MIARICYVMQCAADGLPVKIGVTGNVQKRLGNFRTHNPHPMSLCAIIGGGAATEKELKGFLKDLRITGEWYRPDPRINGFLERKRGERKLLRQVPTDADFCAEHLAPAALQYLAGREPNNNEAGDIISRLLAGQLPDAGARADDLYTATKGAITVELAHGYLPDLSDSAFVPVKLPAAIAKPAGAAA